MSNKESRRRSGDSGDEFKREDSIRARASMRSRALTRMWIARA